MKVLFLALTFSLFGNIGSTKISAKSAILINLDTGAVLYEKHAYTPMYPASITKVATALFALDQKGVVENRTMKVSHDALKIRPEEETGNEPPYWDEKSGTKMWLVPGEYVPFETLLHGLIRSSGNDAANVIAENLSPSIPQFVEEMNAYLAELGCKKTQFKNPHGIHHKEHYTTAYDMSLIFKRALQHGKFLDVSSNSYYERPKTNKQPKGELLNKDPLLIPGKYYYPKVFSVKKGFHSSAKHTIVAAAKSNGRTLLAVLMGCETTQDRCKDTMTLFEAAFNEKWKKKVLFRAFSPIKVQVPGSKKDLKATLLSDLAIHFYPSEEPICKAFVRMNKKVLPISKGQKVGSIEIQDTSGKILEVGDLVAMEDLKPKLLERIFNY